MSIDPKSLPSEYRRQIEQQLKRRATSREASPAGCSGGRKYKNTPAERNGEEGRRIRFDSQKEARRYDELLLMLKAGKIRDLKLQPEFTLSEAYTTPEGDRIRATKYRADFSYYVPDAGGWSPSKDGWIYVVEDVKSKATKTRVYAIKKKLMRERYGIEIQEVE